MNDKTKIKLAVFVFMIFINLLTIYIQLFHIKETSKFWLVMAGLCLVWFGYRSVETILGSLKGD